MANEITVGSEVAVNGEVVEMLNFFNLMAEGKKIDGFGIVKAVNPTKAQIANFKEVNPNADGEGKVLLFDVKADRHFLIETTDVTVKN